MQTASRVVFQVLAKRLQAPVGQVFCQRYREGLYGMRPRDDRVQVDPLLAPRQPTGLEIRKQTRHHDTRFAGATGSNHGQQSSTLDAFLFWKQSCSQCRSEFSNQRVTSEEIVSILTAECIQAFVGVARLAL